MTLEEELMAIEDFMAETARGAGEIVMRHFGRVKLRSSKGDKGDVVTEVDLESERYILERIRSEFPEHNIISEEAGGAIRDERACTWLVDPLDGTRNYLLGIPFFCISLAVAKDGVGRCGAVYDPVHDELFFAARGRGARLNGGPIRVSEETDLDDAVISVSWLRPRVDHARFVRYVERVTRRTSYLRRLGSAAMVCSYVACGRIDAYIQGAINTWDIAAGSLIVEEAGGVVTDFEAHSLDLSRPYTDILAANPALHRRILDEIIRPR